MKPLFNCSQADFILVITTVINAFFDNLAEFTAFSPKYTAIWGNNLRTILKNAEMLPTQDERQAASEELRIKLSQQAVIARKYWQRLKRYITVAFDESLVNIKLMSAGQNLYLKATNENWPSTQMMLNSALKFITANEAELLANDNMPPSFKANFETIVNEFRQRLSDYEDGKQSVMVGTQTLIEALNNVHRQAMPMMLDGQEIFSDNEAVRKQFVFTDVLSRVGGTGLAGIRGKVTDVETGAAIQAANIMMNGVTQVAVTDEEGNYVLNSPSGKYQVTVTAVGYVTRVIDDFTVEVGTVSKLNLSMSKAVEASN